MQKNVLNGKIAIQSLLIVLSIAFLLCGIFAVMWNQIRNDYNSYYKFVADVDFFAICGSLMIIFGVILMTIASIKIASYKKMLQYADGCDISANQSKIDKTEALRNRLVSLGELRAKGLITEEEFETMRLSLVQKEMHEV